MSVGITSNFGEAIAIEGMGFRDKIPRWYRWSRDATGLVFAAGPLLIGGVLTKATSWEVGCLMEVLVFASFISRLLLVDPAGGWGEQLKKRGKGKTGRSKLKKRQSMLSGRSGRGRSRVDVIGHHSDEDVDEVELVERQRLLPRLSLYDGSSRKVPLPEVEFKERTNRLSKDLRTCGVMFCLILSGLIQLGVFYSPLP